MMERVDEMTSPPIIGKRYWVQCAFVPPKSATAVTWGWWPINGQKHDDADIGVPQVHYHYDPRFMSERQFRLREVAALPGAILASILPAAVAPKSSTTIWMDDGSKRVALTVEHRRMTCKRAMPLFPRDRNPPWLPDLESKYANVVAKGCRTCPHRGLPLASLPADKRGVVTCAGHGLQWNQKTGVLVREGQVVL